LGELNTALVYVTAVIQLQANAFLHMLHRAEHMHDSSVITIAVLAEQQHLCSTTSSRITEASVKVVIMQAGL
jgi:hypothetical protein